MAESKERDFLENLVKKLFNKPTLLHPFVFFVVEWMDNLDEITAELGRDTENFLRTYFSNIKLPANVGYGQLLVTLLNRIKDDPFKFQKIIHSFYMENRENLEIQNRASEILFLLEHPTNVLNSLDKLLGITFQKSLLIEEFKVPEQFAEEVLSESFSNILELMREIAKSSNRAQALAIKSLNTVNFEGEQLQIRIAGQSLFGQTKKIFGNNKRITTAFLVASSIQFLLWFTGNMELKDLLKDRLSDVASSMIVGHFGLAGRFSIGVASSLSNTISTIIGEIGNYVLLSPEEKKRKRN